MDLLDRYLQAVKFWLPREQKQDIVAELSEDLRSQIEDRETALGRALTDAEVEAILRQTGRPVLVANRYLPQRYLIGPVWFPVYLFVLKIVAACYLIPWILLWIGLMIFSPAYRADHTSAGWLHAIAEGWGGFWLAAVVAMGTITIVFAVLERAQAKSGFLENWEPRKLPAVRDPNRIPRGNSTLELVANAVFCSWWITAMWSPVVVDRPEVRITLAPVWQAYFLGFVVLAAINMVLAGANLLRPYWTQARAGVRLMVDLAGAVLFSGLCRSNILANIDVAGVAPAKTLHVRDMINSGMAQAIPIVIAIAAVVLVVNVYRIVRVRAARRWPSVAPA